jgi:hypothetical protein
VVGTQVEIVRVSDLLRVTHLNLSGFDPLDHLHVQVQVVVYCVIVELLLFNFIFLLSKREIHPLENIEHFNAVDQHLHFGDARDDVNCDQTLQLHHVLVHLVFIQRN